MSHKVLASSVVVLPHGPEVARKGLWEALADRVVTMLEASGFHEGDILNVTVGQDAETGSWRYRLNLWRLV